MKRKLLLSAILLISTPIIAQEISNTAKPTTTNVEPTTTSNPIIKPVLTEGITIDRKIAAVDAKLAYYSSHPEEQKVAESNGTITALNQQRSELVAEKNKVSIAPQVTVKEPVAVQPVEMKSVGKKPEPETVEHLNSVILAIDNKVAFVKSDQAENQHAIESGWYDKMAQKRAALVEKRDNLIKEQTTK